MDVNSRTALLSSCAKAPRNRWEAPVGTRAGERRKNTGPARYWRKNGAQPDTGRTFRKTAFPSKADRGRGGRTSRVAPVWQTSLSPDRAEGRGWLGDASALRPPLRSKECELGVWRRRGRGAPGWWARPKKRWQEAWRSEWGWRRRRGRGRADRRGGEREKEENWRGGERGGRVGHRGEEERRARRERGGRSGRSGHVGRAAPASKVPPFRYSGRRRRRHRHRARGPCSRRPRASRRPRRARPAVR